MSRMKAVLLAGIMLLMATFCAVFWPEPTGFEDAVMTAPELARLDVNTATVDQLANLPGIGWTMAERIVALREKIGGYDSLRELLTVKGVDSDKLKEWEHYLTVSDETP